MAGDLGGASLGGRHLFARSQIFLSVSDRESNCEKETFDLKVRDPGDVLSGLASWHGDLGVLDLRLLLLKSLRTMRIEMLARWTWPADTSSGTPWRLPSS